MTKTAVRSRSKKRSADKTAPSKSFRSDIQGLRAVAVGTVLLYHAGATYLPGGFVGVDVFFVISGFLITGLLVKEMTTDGGISLSNFYARRAKRILPAATLVLLAVAVLTVTVLPRNRWDSIATELFGSALNVVNWVFASSSTDYLRQDQAASPVQHFWTLAVEEQFYIVWPLLLAVVISFARVQKKNRNEWNLNPDKAVSYAKRVVITLVIPSFVFSVYYTQVNPGAAYFITPTRLWQLGVGAMIALYAAELGRINIRLGAVLGWAGLVAIGFSVVVISGATAYPGYAALLPTLGAAAVIIGGMNNRARSGAGAVLSIAPMVWVGNISYSLYLWHWPMIVIGTYLLDGLTLTQGLSIVALSFIPAFLSYKYVERPILGWKYAADRGTALGLGTITVCCGALAASAILLIPKPVDTSGFVATPLNVSGDSAAVVEEPQRGAELLLSDPSLGEPQDAPGEFQPLALFAAEDAPDTRSRGCHQNVNEDDAEACIFGDENGAYRIAIVGDSHAAQWTPALDRAGKKNGWRVDSYTKSSCALVDTLIMAEGNQATYDNCLSWHDNVVAALTGPSRPDLVLTSGQAYNTADGLPISDSLATTWAALQDAGISVAAIGDTPRPGINVPECALANEDRLTECAVERSAALNNGLDAQVTAAELAGGVDVLDMTDNICPADRCSIVIGGVFVYRDSNHITATYSRTLASPLEGKLATVGAPIVSAT